MVNRPNSNQQQKQQQKQQQQQQQQQISNNSNSNKSRRRSNQINNNRTTTPIINDQVQNQNQNQQETETYEHQNTRPSSSSSSSINRKRSKIYQRNRYQYKMYSDIPSTDPNELNDLPQQQQQQNLRSHYQLSRNELIQGIANRLVFSQVYIYVYLTMIILSLTTILISILSDHCAPIWFYVLEILINLAMIFEVSIRLIAFGKKFWKSKLNIIDCIITLICIMTMIIIFIKGCKAKREEVFDVLVLVVRNFVQFVRLALILRRSGKSIFTRIEPIHLEGVLYDEDSNSLMIDFDDD